MSLENGEGFNVKKNLYYPRIPNFGDELNGILFKNVFGINFNFTRNLNNADYVAIGSSLNGPLWQKNGLGKLKQRILYKILKRSHTKIVVLGTGFWFEPETKPIKFIRKMDFKIVRGELTKKILLDSKIGNESILTGDLGLLSPYLFGKEKTICHKLGIIPHLDDMDSPVFYDIYKKYKNDSILINVKESPDKVISNIISCENIISSSLHGLIIADSYGIPNMWLENKYKKINKPIFKYYDYYSSLGVSAINPVQAIDFENQYQIEDIMKNYTVDCSRVHKKQLELYDFCKLYFENIKMSLLQNQPAFATGSNIIN